MGPHPVAPGDILRLIWTDYVDSQNGELTWGMRVTGITGGSATMEEVCKETWAQALDDWKAKTPTSVKMEYVRAYLLDPATGKATYSGQWNDNEDSHGTVASNCMAKQAAAVYTKYTARVGRRYQGRFFVPFIPVNAVDSEGNLGAGWKALCNAFVANICSAIVAVGAGGTASMVPVLLHLDGSPGAVVTYTDITSVEGRGKIGNQRRRGNYGRTNAPYS